ncbi:MAG: penicillin-binding protein 2 [Patescibacteria group bacterium]
MRYAFIGIAGLIVFRLFSLQVVNAAFYGTLASGQHSFYQELVADRGSLYVKDWKTDESFVAATNEPRAFIYADPRKIEDPLASAQALAIVLDYKIVEIKTEEETTAIIEDAEAVEVVEETEVATMNDAVAEALEGQIGGEDVAMVIEVVEVVEETEAVEDDGKDNGENFLQLVERLSKKDDPYEPVARNIDEDTLNEILALELSGIDYVLENTRSYPEQNLGGQLFGFVGMDSEGKKTGRYGLEGYFNDFLAGKNGYLDTETDAAGRWIGVGARRFDPAIDGGDIELTIDRTVQYIACKKLKEGVERYQADSGSLVILEPSTGKVMAMCNSPDFDPNEYSKVDDADIFNNKSIYGAYEPGSVFKPLIMAAALDVGAVTPTTTYNDTGEVAIDEYVIQNSDLAANGVQTMTQVLEKSLNTGMIFVMRQIGHDVLRSYVEKFGFGTATGIRLDTESSGTIASLSEAAEVYFATASYGQGITVTPLQLAAAYTALANEGSLMKPYIVEALHYADGTEERFYPKVVRQVVSKKTATTVNAMMVSVVENGHGVKAAVPGHYIAGKTGTAQVAIEGGYGYDSNRTRATFAGFGPVEDPAFVAVVTLDYPRTNPWGSETAAPIFAEISEFLLQYLEIAPRRPLE